MSRHQRKAMAIKSVLRLGNNMVMVLDAEGEQIPEYQGQYQDVKESILRDAPPDAVFSHWFNQTAEPETVSRENW